MQQINIREHWLIIKPMLEQLYQRELVRGLPDWIPEDIYAACMNNQAWVYEVDKAYVIVSEERIPHSGQKAMAVWFGLSYAGKDATTNNIGSLVNLAKQAGLTRIEFCSSRPGFQRIASKIGFKLQYSKYIREV